jgi:hypothetical protein
MEVFVEVSILRGSLASLWATSLGLFALPGLQSLPLVLFLSLSWVFSLYEVWEGFIIFTKYINQVTRVNQQHPHWWYLQCIRGGGFSSFCEQLSIGAIMLLLHKASLFGGPYVRKALQTRRVMLS